jgi:hypothetical protein
VKEILDFNKTGPGKATTTKKDKDKGGCQLV